MLNLYEENDYVSICNIKFMSDNELIDFKVYLECKVNDSNHSVKLYGEEVWLI